jgi:hypothetical protein
MYFGFKEVIIQSNYIHEFRFKYVLAGVLKYIETLE